MRRRKNVERAGQPRHFTTERDLLRVLLVEDDLQLATQTARYLEQRGLSVSVAADGNTGQDLALTNDYDCVILDLSLPGRDGIDVCRTVRDRGDVPIIIVSGRDDDADVVLGLEVGADDYVIKPFSSRVLLARIRAAVRRMEGRARTSVCVGRLQLDPASLLARLDDKPIPLTPHEFAILCELARRVGTVVTREKLHAIAGGSNDTPVERSVDAHVSNLREKLGDDGRRPRILKTIRGEGYLLAREGW
jgi:DNA-binding response OmpR family regulator